MKRKSPVKSTPEPDTAKPTEDMCFYNKIPRHFLDEPLPNPNFDDHQFSIPFRAVVVAPSGSGKSSWIGNLISKFCKGAGTFVSIIIVVKNKDEAIYRYLASLSDAIQIKEGGAEQIPPLDKVDKDVANLLIVDDLQNEKNLQSVCDWYIRCRKRNCSICFLSQNYYVTPIVIRRNCNYLVILKLSGTREIKTILHEAGVGITIEQLMNMYEYSTREKFHTFIIDYESNDINHRYRHNFTEYLCPADFV